MNDSWDDPNDSSFTNRVRHRWQLWQEYRRSLTEERRAIRSIEIEEKMRRDSTLGPLDSDQERVSFVLRSPEIPPIIVDDGTDQLISSGSTDHPVESSPLGIIGQLRKSRELKHRIRAERKAIEAEFRSVRLPKNSGLTDDAFAIGGTRQSVLDEHENEKLSTLSLASILVGECFRLRFPQWAIATIPSLAMLTGLVVPAVSNSATHQAEVIGKLSSQWSEMIAAEKWDEAEICGSRILQAELFTLNDNFRFFDCLLHSSQPNRAWRFLSAQEPRQSESSLASFRLRYAENLSRIPNLNSNPQLVSLMIAKTRESLKGPLSAQEEIKARQFLVNVAVSQGDFESAIRLLEPISNRSPFIASDLLFLKFNRASETEISTIRSSASTLLVQVDSLLRIDDSPALNDIRVKSRLMMILDREKEARAWLASLVNLDQQSKMTVSLEIDKLSLLTEVKKSPLRTSILWARLKPLLDSEPNNRTWIRIALGLWAKSDKPASEEIDRWVRLKLDSSETDSYFIREASMSAHLNGRWAEARQVYRKLIANNPDDFSALNNLAGLLYKFEPRDMNEALRLVDKAIELAPKNLIILETKGQILARMGEFEKARTILDQCLPVLPKEWNLHNTLVQVYEELGEKNNAEAHRAILSTIAKPDGAESYEKLSEFLPMKTFGKSVKQP